MTNDSVGRMNCSALSTKKKKSFHNSIWPFILVYGVCLGGIFFSPRKIFSSLLFKPFTMGKASIFCSLIKKYLESKEEIKKECRMTSLYQQNINLKLDIYLKKKMLSLTKQKKTTPKPNICTKNRSYHCY